MFDSCSNKAVVLIPKAHLIPPLTWFICYMVHISVFNLQGDRITMDEQLRDHGNLVQQIINILGDKDLAYNHLQKCIYYVDIGSNDYINNYFMPTLYPTSSIYTPEQFADALIQQYSQQIRVCTSLYTNSISLSS